MRAWLRRTWRRLRDESPGRALGASGHELVAGSIGRAASRAYAHRTAGTPVWERDWDVLCLLDGCRVDLFREVAEAETYEFLPEGDDIETLWSVGSQSAEWMAHTFDAEYAGEMARTAYVSGNPFTGQPGDQLAAVQTDALPLGDDDFGVLYEAWREEWVDEDISTIPPEPLTDAAIAIWRQREALDVDRVIVHYMQPHTPFRSRPDWFLGTANIEDWGRLDDGDDGEDGDGDSRDGTAESPDASGVADPDDEDLVLEEFDEETLELLAALNDDTEAGRDPWTRLRDGELPADEFWTAYRDNLRWVLDDVARLVENCDGRVVFSSDHGNAAGEFGVWSHPPAVHLPALREVPWVEVAGDDRGTHEPTLPDALRGSTSRVHSPPSADDESANRVDGNAEQRLADLGYR